MCVVSMIMDHYRDRWTPYVQPYWPSAPIPNQPQRPWEEIAELLKPKPTPQAAITNEEIAEFRRLLERAREYDKQHDEPNCELEEKRTALLAIAKALGIDISFINAEG